MERFKKKFQYIPKLFRIADVRIKKVDGKGISDKLSPVYQTGINLRNI